MQCVIILMGCCGPLWAHVGHQRKIDGEGPGKVGRVWETPPVLELKLYWIDGSYCISCHAFSVFALRSLAFARFIAA